MVVFQIKSSENDTFLYEVSSDTNNDKVIREIVDVWNMRIRLFQLVGGIRDLAKFGPMKPPDKAGLDHIEESYKGVAVDKGEFYEEDPTGNRTGNGIGPHLTSVFERVAADAEASLDKSNVSRKIATSIAVLQEKLDNIRGAVIMAFPMGLPDYDTVKLTIDGLEGLEGTAAGQEILDGSTAEVWIASRCLDRSQRISDRFGRNEKTKVIAKVQKPGAGQPGREAAVSEDEKKAMMAFYFKKQEEMKKLAESSEDEYLHSSWADPKQLQRSLRGQSTVRAPGLR